MSSSKPDCPTKLLNTAHCACCGNPPRVQCVAPCGHVGCRLCFLALRQALTGPGQPHAVCPVCDAVFTIFWMNGQRFFEIRKAGTKADGSKLKTRKRKRGSKKTEKEDEEDKTLEEPEGAGQGEGRRDRHGGGGNRRNGGGGGGQAIAV